MAIAFIYPGELLQVESPSLLEICEEIEYFPLNLFLKGHIDGSQAECTYTFVGGCEF